jgi:hypothetical protein
MVGEARAALNIGDPMSMVLRAISLEPAEAHYHLTAASVLFRQKKVDDAIAHAQTAQALADSEEERRRAAELLERLARAKGFRP